MAEKWFTIKQLYPQIWGIAEFGHFEEVISYLFVGNKEALLFDTGMGIGDIASVVGALTEYPITVVNSHSHYDHIGGNAAFDSIVAFKTSFSLDRSKTGYGINELAEVIDPLNFYIKSPMHNFNNFSIKPYAITSGLTDEESIQISPFTFRVIHTPGHTPDSICLYEETNKILLTGDTLYDGPIYLHFKESNSKDYIESIEKLNNINEILAILPSHNSFKMEVNNLKKVKKILESSGENLSDEVEITRQLKLIVRI